MEVGSAVTGITGGLGGSVGKIGEGDLLGGAGSVLGVLHRARVACWAAYLTDLELIVGKVLMLMSF